MTKETGLPSFADGVGTQIKGRVTTAQRILDEILEPEYLRLGITVAEADLLTVIRIAAHDTAPTELATWLGLTTAGMTARLNALETHEFIERRAHATDGRRRTVHLTTKGREMADLVLETKDRVVSDAIASALGPDRARDLIDLLDQAISAGRTAQTGPHS